MERDSCSESDGEGYITPNEVAFADDESSKQFVGISGSNVDGGPIVVSADLQQKIVEQVEWYFSDENLLKDSFLMKHIHRNKQGLVSLKLVASFRKVKSLTKDWRVVQASLMNSSLLELNAEANKIKRKAPPPDVDYSHTRRTVIVQNYQADPLPSPEQIENEFSKYGDVSLVRILRPGSAVPMDVKPSRKRYANIGKELCILVEYESEEGAKRACKLFASQQSWRDQINVSMLCVRPEDDGVKPREGKKPDEGHFLSPSKSHSHRNGGRSPSPSTGNKKRHKGSLSPCRKLLSSDKNVEKEYLSDTSCNIRRSRSPRLSPEPIRKFPSDQMLSRPHRNSVESRIIRQPWGPDGTRGFIKTPATLPPVVVSIS